MQDIEHRPVVIPKATYDLLLKQKEPLGLIGLYNFYYYTAIWQHTNKPHATTNYAAKGLKVSAARIRRYKATLIKLGLIEEFTKRTDDNKFAGCFIRVKYYSGNSKSSPGLPILRRPGNPKANAYNYNNKLFAKQVRKSECLTFDKKCSIKLEELLREKRKFNSRTKPRSWPDQFLEFRRKNNITKKRMWDLLKWYCKHFGQPYVPKAYFANMFCDKFCQIEDARERLIKEIKNGKPRTVVRKRTGSDVIYGDEPQSLEE